MFLWIMFAGLIGNMVTTVMLYAYSKKVSKIRFKWSKTYIKSLIKTTIPYGLALFLNVIYFKVDVILISVIEPAPLHDVSIALYSVPMKIIEVGMMFGTLFLNSLLPVFTRAIVEKKPEELLNATKHAYRILFVFGAGIVGAMLALAKPLILFLANAQYLDASKHMYTSLDAFNVVMLVFLFYFLSSLFTYLLIAAGEQSKLLKINAYLTIINIIGNIVLIPYFSFFGSACMTLVCQILLLFWTYRASRHLVVFRFDFIFSAYTIFAA